MSLTALTLITEALEELGALASGETPTSDDQAKALRVLNRMLDSQAIDRGMIFTQEIDAYTLTSSKQSYTIGVDPAGVQTPDFSAARPVKITSANVIMASGSTTVRLPLHLASDKEWSQVRVQQVTGLPRMVYNDGSSPLSTLYLYPIPDQAYQLELYTWQQFVQFATTATVFQLPPGYYEYLVLGLAMRLAAPFGRPVAATTQEVFAALQSKIARMNNGTPRLKSEYDGRGGGLYNWKSGMTEA